MSTNRNRTAYQTQTLSLFLVAATVCATTSVATAAPELSFEADMEVPMLYIGPVAGLTSEWHVAPSKIAVPVGSALTFQLDIAANAEVVWTGAFEFARSPASSMAQYSTATVGAGTLHVLLNEAWNVQIPYLWQPPDQEMHIISPTEWWTIALPTAPADSLTMDGTLTWMELGG